MAAPHTATEEGATNREIHVADDGRHGAPALRRKNRFINKNPLTLAP